jgi:hypothetical protein
MTEVQLWLLQNWLERATRKHRPRKKTTVYDGPEGYDVDVLP